MDVDGDEHWVYSLQSNANWKNDSNTKRALFVSVWTNATWDIDQTNETVSSSRAVIWFHDKVLFAWRAFPYHNLKSWKIEAQGTTNNWKYNTSYTNYYNVAIMDLCFQMFAEVKDVDELLEMVRSTSDTDYIRFDLNGDWDTNDTVDNQPETQPLQLMNPAKFFKKYLMPINIPSYISAWETIPIEKGYYKGVLFDIPGAEVLIDGEWLAYDGKNKDRILAQNPMDLAWRLNGDLLRKLGYTPGQTLEGRIIAVDDQWLSLRLDVPFTVQLQ